VLAPGSRVLFTGDSITDGDRDRDGTTWRTLGSGYAMIAAALHRARHPERAVDFRNTGVSGSRVKDLRRVWDDDCLRIGADVVSILVGINDTGFRYDFDDPIPVEDYERDYRDIVHRAGATGATIVLIEPFLLPVKPDQHRWREDLDPKIAVVHKLAADHGALLVTADALLTARAAATGPEYWCFDGVHPTPAGHALLAEEWLRVVDQR
jgi:lysophospholipase L1-like esterase